MEIFFYPPIFDEIIRTRSTNDIKLSLGQTKLAKDVLNPSSKESGGSIPLAGSAGPPILLTKI